MAYLPSPGNQEMRIRMERMTTPGIASMISIAIYDLRLALRSMLKRPSFVIAALLMLGMGTGVNAALFGIIHSVVFQPLPAKQADQLITFSQKASGGVSLPDLQDLRAQNRSFQQMEAYLYSAFSFRDKSGTELIIGAQVTPGYLSMLGVEPLVGRVFDLEQDQAGQDHSVILSEALWKSRFAANPDVIGTTIHLNGEPYTIQAVMPQEVRLPYDSTQLWVPVPANSPWRQNRGNHALRLLARLKSGVSVQDAQTDVNFLTARLAQLYPKEDGSRSVIVVGLQEALVSYVRPKLYLLVFATVFIFLISSANVVSLSLTRASDRMREIAIRKALGATRWRLIYQFAIENFLLAMLGSIVGWVLARWWVSLIVALKPARLPRLYEIHLDYSVFVLLTGFTFAIATGLAIVNIFEFDRLKLNDALAAGGRGAISGHRQWVRNTLVGVEVATAVMLLIGAGLLIRSFQRIYTVDFGFTPKNRLTLHLSLPAEEHSRSAYEIYQPVYERVRALPGVSAVGVSNVLPLQGSFDTEYFIEGLTAPDAHISGEARMLNEDYLQAMGIVLVSGRQFTAQDDEKSPLVAIINRRMAKQWFPNQDPIGHRIRALGNQDWRTIVGVVADVRDSTIESEGPVEFFLPYRQNPFPPALWNIGMVVQMGSDASTMLPAVKNAIHSVHPEITLSGIETMDQVIADSLRDRRLVMTLLALFASLAVVLATYGIYSLLAYSVRQRTREIGVRMAMGADRWNILRHVTFQGMRIVIVALMAGTAGAYVLSRILASLLFGVNSTDPLTFTLANVFLLLIACCAMLLPAWRGARLDPLEALRFE